MADIIDLNNSFSKAVKTKAFMDKQTETIVSLQKENEQLKANISHLKSLLDSAVPTLTQEIEVQESPVERLISTTEEGIVEMQISKLQEISIARTLSLDEIRALDLLVKNKLILAEKKAEVISSSPKKIDKKGLTSMQLLQIAATKKPDIR